MCNFTNNYTYNYNYNVAFYMFSFIKGKTTVKKIITKFPSTPQYLEINLFNDIKFKIRGKFKFKG